MKKVILSKLTSLPYFSKNVLRNVTHESSNTLNVSIKRMIKREELIKLKNGLYTTKYFFERNGHLVEYKELVANMLCQPSYLSLEYVLSKYDMLTEGVRIYTSVSLKTTRNYENILGGFSYKKIANEIFVGFETKFFGKSTFQIASKAKALFDWLYFRTDSILLTKENFDIIKENRVRIELMNKNDWREINKYLKKVNNRKTKAIKLSLKPYAPNFQQT